MDICSHIVYRSFNQQEAMGSCIAVDSEAMGYSGCVSRQMRHPVCSISNPPTTTRVSVAVGRPIISGVRCCNPSVMCLVTVAEGLILSFCDLMQNGS